MFERSTRKIPVPRTELLAGRAAVLASDAGPDPRAAALRALADACGLSAQIFSGLEQHLVKRRIAAMLAGQWTAAAVREAVRRSPPYRTPGRGRRQEQRRRCSAARPDMTLPAAAHLARPTA
jgi:hypothetical protein